MVRYDNGLQRECGNGGVEKGGDTNWDAECICYFNWALMILPSLLGIPPKIGGYYYETGYILPNLM